MKNFTHLFLRILPLCMAFGVASTSATAQNELPHRKPGNLKPVTDSGIPEVAVETERPQRTAVSGLPATTQVPVYDRIETPVRWYALELADSPEYWRGVNAERIWIQLEKGFSFEETEITEFLEEQGLTNPVGESGGTARGPVQIFHVEGAGAEQVVDLARAAKEVPGILFLEPAVVYKRHFEPNDPYYPQQWGPYVSYFDFAWDESIGGNSMNVLAVIDDACDWNHEDLYDIVWYGWDYAQNDYDITPDDPNNHKHGTHTTGTVAAKTNNGIGVAGMVSDTVYFAKVGMPDGSLNDQAIVDAIYDIADISRVMAVNMSLGGDSPSAAIEQACNYAWNAGKILLVSSGNNGQGTIAFPAAYTSTVAVGAIGSDGTQLYLTSYSQYGDEQELCAPGGDMQNNYGIVSCIPLNQYEAMEGTSMAAPHVTGLAGLMKHVNMSLTNSDIRNIMAATAIDFGDTGWDPIFGYGMIHAQNAVAAAIDGTVGIADLNGREALRIYPNPATDRLLIDLKADVRSGVYQVFDMEGRCLLTTAFEAGNQSVLTLDQMDPGVYVLRMRSEIGDASVRFVKL